MPKLKDITQFQLSKTDKCLLFVIRRVRQYNYEHGTDITLKVNEEEMIFQRIIRDARFFVFIGKYGVHIQDSQQRTRVIKILEGHQYMGDAVLYFHGTKHVEITIENCDQMFYNLRYGKRPKEPFVPAPERKKMITESDWEECASFKEGKTKRPNQRRVPGHGFQRTWFAANKFDTSGMAKLEHEIVNAAIKTEAKPKRPRISKTA